MYNNDQGAAEVIAYIHHTEVMIRKEIQMKKNISETKIGVKKKCSYYWYVANGPKIACAKYGANVMYDVMGHSYVGSLRRNEE